MRNTTAPFYREVARGPDRAAARWVRAPDGVRLRIAIWPEGDRGTVLLFPGRTEYVEKYGPTAARLRGRGFATVSVDWRGQGLAERPLPDRGTGHVSRFTDYQMDVTATLATVRELGLAYPYYLLAHSMGGCIGLRSMVEGLDVRAAVFSAPMWGIAMRDTLRPFAWTLALAARALRFGHIYSPGTGPRNHLGEVSFEKNLLTTDPQMYAFMRNQLASHPDLALGGPSLHWLHEALNECSTLARTSSPEVPAVTFLGSRDHVVDPIRIHRRMVSWPNGRLVVLRGAKHEPMMETPEHRNRFYMEVIRHFERHP